MKKLLLIATIALAFSFTSCTENSRVKNWGGTGTLDLPAGQKLINITWKDNQIWYLTRPMTATDSAETYTFQEESSYGVMEGTFYVKEHK